MPYLTTAKLRVISRYLFGIYLLVVLAYAIIAKCIGESNSFIAATLYLPASFWFLPLIVILPLQFIVDAKNSMFSLPAFGLLSCYYFGVSWNFSQPNLSPIDEQRLIKVITFNQGQSTGSSIAAFVEQHQPDLVALQETTAHRTRQYITDSALSEYPYQSFLGEFGLISQHPILDQQLVVGSSGAIAARYTIHFNGQLIRVYSVHLRSPRKALYTLKNLGVAFSTPSPNPNPQHHPYPGTFWSSQIKSAKLLSRLLQDETLPCIALGDTNAPPMGKIHSILTEKMTDAHESIGRMSGFTFPGESKYFLTNFKPWLRLDKILINSQITPLRIEVESQQKSQHRAVAATLKLHSP